MSDIEFDVLDELYFVTSFYDLQEQLEVNEKELKEILSILLKKNWVKCFRNMSEEIVKEELDFEYQFKSYFYLATKSGLLAHNGME